MSSVFQHKCSFITIKDSSNCSAIRTTSNSLFRYSILLSTKLKSSNKLILKPKSHRVSSTSNHAEIWKCHLEAQENTFTSMQTFKYKMSSVFQHKCSFITIKDSSNCSAIRTTSNSLFRYSILLSTKLKSSNKLILKPKSHNVSSTSNHAEIFKKK